MYDKDHQHKKREEEEEEEEAIVMASLNGEVEVPLLEKRKEGGGATWMQTLGNIVVSIVGTGVLGLPYAFMVAGWLAGSLGIAAAGICTYYTMTLLVECRKRLHEEEGESVQIQSYGDLGFKAFGSKGRYLTEILVFISQAGGAIAYFIFIGQNLSSIFSTNSRLIQPSTFLFFILLPLEIALSFIKSLSTLAPFSAFADACNVLAMAIVIKDDFELFNGFTEMRSTAFNGIWGLPFAGGVAVFCFEGFSMTLPLESSMADQGMFRWVLSKAFTGVTFVYICFGFFGYMAYGDGTRDIVTLNLPNDWSSIAVKVGLCVALAFTFPIMMHPIHDMAEARLKRSGWFQKLCHNLDGVEWLMLHIVRTILVALMAVLASFIPGFGAFISFIGSTVCALLSFVLPAFFHLTFMGSSLSFWRWLLDWSILVLGLVFAGYGTYSAASGHAMG